MGGTPPPQPYGNNVCSGGNGGPGSGGGGGGGGAGGCSLGLAWSGTSTITIDGDQVGSDIATAGFFSGGVLGVGGSEGLGGNAVTTSTGFAQGRAGPAGGKGADGVVYAVKKL